MGAHQAVKGQFILWVILQALVAAGMTVLGAFIGYDVRSPPSAMTPVPAIIPLVIGAVTCVEIIFAIIALKTQKSWVFKLHGFLGYFLGFCSLGSGFILMLLLYTATATALSSLSSSTPASGLSFWGFIAMLLSFGTGVVTWLSAGTGLALRRRFEADEALGEEDASGNGLSMVIGYLGHLEMFTAWCLIGFSLWFLPSDYSTMAGVLTTIVVGGSNLLFSFVAGILAVGGGFTLRLRTNIGHAVMAILSGLGGIVIGALFLANASTYFKCFPGISCSDTTIDSLFSVGLYPMIIGILEIALGAVFLLSALLAIGFYRTVDKDRNKVLPFNTPKGW